jgi:hypothetical protein
MCCRPARGDWVGLVGETFGDAAVRAMAQRMRDSPTGRQILAERPRVTVSAHLPLSWYQTGSTSMVSTYCLHLISLTQFSYTQPTLVLCMRRVPIPPAVACTRA